MLGLAPLSSTPISALPAALTGAGAVTVPTTGGSSDAQSQEQYTGDGITALFDATGAAERRRRRLAETRRALGLLPAPEPLAAPVAATEALPVAVSYATVLADEQARQDALKAADLAIAEARIAVALQARAARIARDDGDVLMMIAELV